MFQNETNDFKRTERNSMMLMAAVIFCLFAMVAMIFQFLLAAGLPWGEWTMGGKYSGQLPVRMRFGAVLQGAIIFVMMLIVLSASGLWLEHWNAYAKRAVWVVCVFFVLGSVLNLISFSSKERLLWTPVNILLLISSLIVALY